MRSRGSLSVVLRLELILIVKAGSNAISHDFTLPIRSYTHDVDIPNHITRHHRGFSCGRRLQFAEECVSDYKRRIEHICCPNDNLTAFLHGLKTYFIILQTPESLDHTGAAIARLSRAGSMQAGYVSTVASFTRLSKLISGVLAVVCVFTAVFPSARAYLALVPGR